VSNRGIFAVSNIRATNYFANLFINICCFNNIFLVNNREIDTNQTVIYLQEINLFAIEENIFVLTVVSFFFYT